ncbi:MAG: T9SS C-terminal target domain-containing protein, partial [Bacteroidetes bacterium]
GEIALHYVNDNPIINIHAAAESIATLELIGLNGITLYTQKQSVQPGENSFAINGNLNTGLYVLKVQLENKVAVFKVWIK